jgi:hypothetical protein
VDGGGDGVGDCAVVVVGGGVVDRGEDYGFFALALGDLFISISISTVL